MGLKRGRRRWPFAVLLLCSVIPGAMAQSLGDEALAKAKLVTALIRFVQWPSAAFEQDGSQIRLCVYSQSKAVERAFLTYQDTAVGGRSLKLAFNPPREARGCQALYVDELSGSALAGPTRSQAGEARFTIGTADGFIADGGMVEVVHVENTMRFDVNLVALHDAGLTINPGVLKLARRVKQ